jgi:TRAP-type C4-dicarboxylate transport system substrate-binding protein
MKNWIITAFAGLAFLAAGGAASAQTIKLGTLAPKGSPWFDNLQDMASDWGEASNGSIRVRIYPGGSIGDEQDMVRKMQIGQLQGAVLTAEGLSIIVPEVLALQMPMIFKTDGELDYARDALTPELEALFEERGYKILNWGDIGWVRLFARDPAVTVEDLGKQKLFTWAGDRDIQRPAIRPDRRALRGPGGGAVLPVVRYCQQHVGAEGAETDRRDGGDAKDLEQDQAGSARRRGGGGR